MVKPNPCGERRRMMGGLRDEKRGQPSRLGEASRDEAVLDHPGLWIPCTGFSSKQDAHNSHKSTEEKT